MAAQLEIFGRLLKRGNVMVCAQNIKLATANELLDKNTEKLVGEVMTFIEAVIPVEKQANATKATIKQFIWKFNRALKNSFIEKTTSNGGE